MPTKIRDNPNQGRVYDINGIAPCLVDSSGGGGLQPMIIETKKEESIIVASRGRNPENPSDRTAGKYVEQTLEPQPDGISNTLTTVQKDNLVLEKRRRIRKLTPRECWRLMNFSDLDFFSAMLLDRKKAEWLLENYKGRDNGIEIRVRHPQQQGILGQQRRRQTYYLPDTGRCAAPCGFPSQ